MQYQPVLVAVKLIVAGWSIKMGTGCDKQRGYFKFCCGTIMVRNKLLSVATTLHLNDDHSSVESLMQKEYREFERFVRMQ